MMNRTHGVLEVLRRRGEDGELVVDVGEDRIIQSIPDSEGVVAPDASVARMRPRV